MIEDTTQSNHSGEVEPANKELNGLDYTTGPDPPIALSDSKPCCICGVPALCYTCSHSGCTRTVHLHCVERVFPGLSVEEEAVSCDLHSRKGGKSRELGKLLLARSVAQRVSTQDQVLMQLKKMDQKNHHWATGNVFWYVLNHQFFPSLYSLTRPPSFPAQNNDPCEVVSEDPDAALATVQAELARVGETNSQLWEQVLAQMSEEESGQPQPKREDELVLSDIVDFSLKSVNETYLNHLEQQFKRTGERPSDPVQKSTNLRGVAHEEEEDFKCSVCGDGDYEDDDLIVICSKCEMGAHMKCYGITHIPDSDWFCEPCMHVEALDERLKLPCALCTVRGGALKLTENDTSEKRQWPNFPFTGTPQRVWCHVFCVFHLEQAAIKDPVHMTRIDLSLVDAKRFSMRCQLCNTKDGACIQCQFRRCQSSFHPECGKHLFVNTRDKTGYDEVRIYCIEHKPLNIRRVLAVREKRAVEEVVTFSRLVDKLSRKKRRAAVRKSEEESNFSYKDKFELFEVAEKYLDTVLRTQSDSFRIHMKKANSLAKLRSKVDVTRPKKYTVMDPYSVFTKGFKVARRKAEDLFHFYASEVYPIMKNEVILLKQDVVTYKPKRKRKVNKKEWARGRKRAKFAPAVQFLPVKESEDVYCICRKPFVENALPFLNETDEAFQARTQANAMLGCDYCEEWYHYLCLGLPFDFAESPWKCPKCSETTDADN